MNKKNICILILIIVILFAGIRISTSIIENNNREKNNVSGDLNTETSGENIDEITLNIFNKSGDAVYTENLITDEQYLFDVLLENKEKINMVYEDGPYGAYIVSMMGIEQGDNYYWSYYINGEYAQTGISNCLITSGDVYEFKIEQFNY